MAGNSSSWTTTTIGSACRVGDGAHGSLKRYDSGIMYLTSKNFKSDGLDLSKVDYIDEKTYHKYFKQSSTALTKPSGGDVLCSIIGSIGSPYVVKTNDHFGISSSVAILRPDTSQVLSEYLYYWIKGSTYQDALYGIKGGVAQGYVSLEMIRSLPLHYPDLPTQRKIAEVLSAYDDLIEINTRRIRILEQLAQSVYREWFGKVDAQSLPEGWKIKTISDLCEFISRGVTPKYIEGSKRYVINQKANRGSSIDISNLKELDPDLYVPEEKFARVEDVLINSLGEGTLGRVHYFLGPDKAWAVDQHMTICRSSLPGVTLLIYFYLSSDEGQSRIEGLKTGGTNMTMFNISEVRQFGLVVPPGELMKKFYDFVNPFWQMKRALELKNANLRQTRDLLLPRLVSGEIELAHE